MKKALLFASLTALLVPALAQAQDAGPEPEACGDVDNLGECDGTDAIWLALMALGVGRGEPRLRRARRDAGQNHPPGAHLRAGG